MELKQLLETQNPTLDQYAACEAWLQGEIVAAQTEIEGLNADDRARAVDRVIGVDDGGAERQAARTKAQARMDDLHIAMADVRGKSSALQCQIDKAADVAAWNAVKAQLDRRSKGMRKIQALLDQAVGVFWDDVDAATSEARKLAPVKPSGGAYTDAQGGAPGTLAVAVVAYLHSMLDRPLGRLHVDINGSALIYEKAVRTQGLDGFLEPTENVIMAGSHC